MPTDANIQSGGPQVYYYTEGQALPEFDDLAPGGVIDWSGSSWTQVPYPLESVKIKFAEESEDIIPAHMMWRIFDVITKKGVDTITFEWGERDLDALKLVLPTSVAGSGGSAGASQTGYDALTDGGETGSVTYYTLALVFRAPGATDYFYILHFKKVRFVGDFELELGNTVTKVPVMIKVFARTAETDGEEVFAMYEQTGDATS
jgi:hypothetical protein